MTRMSRTSAIAMREPSRPRFGEPPPRRGRLVWLGLMCLTVALTHFPPRPAVAQPPPPAPAGDAGADASRVGRWVKLPEVCDEAAAATFARPILDLQAEARRKSARATLFIEVGPGRGSFAGIRQVARLLSQDVPDLQTVAWVPAPLTGPRGVVALACREMALGAKGEVGDLSAGQPLDPDEQAFLINLANRGNNPLLNEALMLGLLDRRRELVWVRFQGADQQRVTRVLQRPELAELQQRGVVIERVQTLKEPDSPGVLSADKCRSFGIVARLFGDSREQVQQAAGLKPGQMLVESAAGETPRVLHLRLRGRLDRQQVDFAQRQLRSLAGRHINLLLVEIDLDGGEPGLALSLASNLADLGAQGVRTVAWIPTAALGAAAILPLGCDAIWMGPRAQWGDAAAGDRPGRRPDAETDLRRLALAMAELARPRERSAALAAAMVSNAEPVQIARDAAGRTVYCTAAELAALGGAWEPRGAVAECGTGQPLVVSADRANELGLADPPVADEQAVAARLGLNPGERWQTARQDWVDRLVFALNRPWLTGLLLLVALLLFYFEAHLPIGAFAIGGVLCFALFFWSRFLGGTAGWLEVVLFVIGLLCLGVEVFLLPGFGVFGVAGGGLCLLAVIMAMQTVVIPQTAGDLRGFAESIFVLGGACAGVVALAAVAGRYLPEMPLLSRLVLTPPGLPPESTGPQLRPELVGHGSPGSPPGHEWLGRQGRAASILRPAGRAEFEGVPVDVVSEGPFIPAGRPVVVIELRGNQVVVREVRPSRVAGHQD